MVRIVLRDQDQEKLHKLSEELAAELADAAAAEGDAVRHQGPDAVRDQPHRRLLPQPDRDDRPDAARLQRVLARVREKGGLPRASGSRWTWIRCRCCGAECSGQASAVSQRNRISG